MCTFDLKTWTGRTGNNILQLLSCIKYCIDNNIRILKIPDHPFFILKTNIICENGCNCQKIINVLPLHNNIYDNTIPIQDLKKLYDTYVSCIIYHKYNIPTYDICIHIRSGDTFSPNPHPYYVPLPLNYYKNIINKNKDKKIKIVYECTRNPIINLLISEYKDTITFQRKSLVEDIQDMADCRTLVVSPGTFFYLPYFISKTINSIIIPDYIYKLTKFGNLYGELFNVIPLPNYIELGKWSLSQEDINKLITYKN